jgi:hypothetical protein
MNRHQRMFRNGWSIPRSMEWLFWPFGFSGLPMERRYIVADGLSIFRNVDLKILR